MGMPGIPLLADTHESVLIAATMCVPDSREGLVRLMVGRCSGCGDAIGWNRGGRLVNIRVIEGNILAGCTAGANPSGGVRDLVRASIGIMV